MKREDLRKLLLGDQTELTEAQTVMVDQIMTLHGKDVEKAKGDVGTTQAALEAKDAEIAALKQQITDANTQIEAFKGMDIEGVKKAAEEYKAQAEQAQKDAAERVSQVEFNYSLDSALITAKAKDVVSLKPHLDISLLKRNPDGTISGLSEQVEKIKSDKPYLFVDDTPTPAFTTGATPPSASTTDSFMASAFKAAKLPLPKG
jgi:small-conductance mechanosensitive channel